MTYDELLKMITYPEKSEGENEKLREELEVTKRLNLKLSQKMEE